MSPTGYAAEVTGLSPNATEKDVDDFFAFSGSIEHVEIVRSGEYACTAYVTFKDAYALENAVLLSGATIIDQRICITRWGQYEDEFDIWNRSSWKIEEETSSSHGVNGNPSIPTAGEAVEVVKSMLSKGYVLGKDALSKAKALDESHQVSATAAEKVSEMSKRIGFTDKISAGVGAVMSVDEKYGVSETTKSAVSATGRTAVAAANSVINSSYFSMGALWVSDALNKAAKAAADLGSHGSKN
ncbi:hypothetical protein IFM89_030759 [Coptis chinensis]|uniref:RRM domain-containing protein n=1 Tax=Coptis chinensis TaxID=261450 RepID=A0A835IZ62_9MAGN|nr:hypothetical protein IFM89_030759 [Coptis chinensis]